MHPQTLDYIKLAKQIHCSVFERQVSAARYRQATYLHFELPATGRGTIAETNLQAFFCRA